MTATTESGVQTQTRLALARMGALVYRNNVGVAQDQTGRHIRYGLANESAKQNRHFKSSDLIGAVPVLIQPHHVGQVLGVFGAFECKHPGWHLTDGNERGQAQARFIELVSSVGGFAGFVTDPSDLDHIVWR